MLVTVPHVLQGGVAGARGLPCRPLRPWIRQEIIDYLRGFLTLGSTRSVLRLAQSLPVSPGFCSGQILNGQMKASPTSDSTVGDFDLALDVICGRLALRFGVRTASRRLALRSGVRPASKG